MFEERPLLITRASFKRGLFFNGNDEKRKTKRKTSAVGCAGRTSRRFSPLHLARSRRRYGNEMIINTYGLSWSRKEPRRGRRRLHWWPPSDGQNGPKGPRRRFRTGSLRFLASFFSTISSAIVLIRCADGPGRTGRVCGRKRNGRPNIFKYFAGARRLGAPLVNQTATAFVSAFRHCHLLHLDLDATTMMMTIDPLGRASLLVWPGSSDLTFLMKSLVPGPHRFFVVVVVVVVVVVARSFSFALLFLVFLRTRNLIRSTICPNRSESFT